MNPKSFEKFLAENSDKRFCLHNGYAGISYGSPLNPKWITNERAFKILVRYERLTGSDPILNYDKLWLLDTLSFTKKAWVLKCTTRHRMIGFNNVKGVIYSDKLLG